MKKKFWPFFSRIIECDKPQGTICKGLQGFLANTVVVIRLILEKKRQTFQWKKYLAYTFLYCPTWQRSVNNLLGHTRFFDMYRLSYMFISIGPKRLLETNISKKGSLPVDKSFWPIFCRNIECDKPQGTIDKEPQGNLAFTMEVIGSIL